MRLGHEVHLVCQERHADEFEFVGATADWDHGELALRRIRDASCTVYRPDIGSLLPVYVRDRYEGLEARPFPELSEAELDAYLEANVRAVQEVAARADVEVALANHLVMGPAILARALAASGIPYAVKVHGSALEYTVKPHPRFRPYAREGIAAANGVLVGSRHVAESLWAALGDRSLPARTRLGPPGVDARAFQPRERGDALTRLQTMSSRIADDGLRRQPMHEHGSPAAAAVESAFRRDDAATASAVGDLAAAAASGPLIAFVGKLIVAKGIDLLLAAWPLVLDAVPDARLAIVGFGAYREAVERWIDALAAGDLDGVHDLAAVGRAAEGGAQSALELVLAFLERLRSSDECERYVAAARLMPERVILTGRLEHAEVAEVLPLCEALVVPSTFPESFGMVAVEAAACGALPISAAHSGLLEVAQALAKRLPGPVRELTSFPLGSDAVQAIAARVSAWLRAPPELRAQTQTALVETVTARYSWEGVARAVIAAARGDLELLDGVG